METIDVITEGILDEISSLSKGTLKALEYDTPSSYS